MPEDTLKEATVEEQETLIQEMLRDAQSTELPSDLKTNPVVHRPDGELAVPMTVHEISSAGYVRAWDTRTFEEVAILYYMLPQKLRQRRKDGSFRFTTNDPKRAPVQGNIKCILHKDDPKREIWDTRGYSICPKSNIKNPYELRQHMLRKHPAEWKGMEEERAERERQEDRELYRSLARAATKTEDNQRDSKFYCLKCGMDFGTEKTRDRHAETCKG